MSLALTQRVSSCRAVRPVRPSAKVSRSGVSRPLAARFIVRAEPKADVAAAIKEAEDTCSSGTTGECAAAWDTVEEISAAVADKKQSEAAEDPLDKFCKDNPETDECRVYED